MDIVERLRADGDEEAAELIELLRRTVEVLQYRIDEIEYYDCA